MLGRDRFLSADNASLAVIGGVQKSRLMRALRQLLGPWAKSERTIPATFRQPAAPDERILALDQPGAANAEIRLALRGLARGDSGALAADLLTLIVRDRWEAAVADLSSTSARNETHLLPGIFVLSATAPSGSASKAVSAAQEIMKSLAQNGPTASELEKARLLMLTEISREMSQSESIADAWLDVETFKSPRPDTIPTLVRSLAASDIQRVAARLFKDAPLATVVVGDYNQLKAAFGEKIIRPPGLPDAKVIDRDMPTRKP